ncbi:hypothetical protein D3C87_2076790 [compost metagenome]
MDQQPGVGTSAISLPAARSTTLTEVAGVAFWTKAYFSSPESASRLFCGATCAIFGETMISRFTDMVSTSNSCSTASVGP